MGFELDLTFTPEDNQVLEAGTVRQPGWYRAILQNIAEEPDKGFWEFIYHVTAGPWSGSTIKDQVWKPEQSADTDKAETATKRIKLILKRLGVWDGNPVSKPFDLVECVGRECFVKLVDDSYTSKKTGLLVKTVKVEWAGVYGLDHEKVPEEIRNPGSAGSTSARGTGARRTAGVIVPPPPPKPKPDYSDL